MDQFELLRIEACRHIFAAFGDPSIYLAKDAIEHMISTLPKLCKTVAIGFFQSPNRDGESVGVQPNVHPLEYAPAQSLMHCLQSGFGILFLNRLPIRIGGDKEVLPENEINQINLGWLAICTTKLLQYRLLLQGTTDLCACISVSTVAYI